MNCKGNRAKLLSEIALLFVGLFWGSSLSILDCLHRSGTHLFPASARDHLAGHWARRDNRCIFIWRILDSNAGCDVRHAGKECVSLIHILRDGAICTLAGQQSAAAATQYNRCCHLYGWYYHCIGGRRSFHAVRRFAGAVERPVLCAAYCFCG